MITIPIQSSTVDLLQSQLTAYAAMKQNQEKWSFNLEVRATLPLQPPFNRVLPVIYKVDNVDILVLRTIENQGRCSRPSPKF